MNRPNLLFLMTDQQRADTIEPHTVCHTPNLDKLASEGVQFTRCYTVNPICSPARASLMSGILPHNHGMVDAYHSVPSYRASFDTSLPLWPQMLQRAGYDTAYFGKWHVERSDRLENFGFDTYEVDQYQQKLGLVQIDERLAHRRMVSHKGYDDFLLYGVSDQPVESLPEYQMFSDGIAFLEKAAADRSQPWALFLSTEAPHDPYVAPQHFYARYDLDQIEPPANFNDDLAGRPAIYRRIQSVWDNLNWEDFAQTIACYYANCTMVDEQIGRILDALEVLGFASNTIIIFTSDHGDYMGDHHLLLKGVPAFEGVYRIPFLLSGPGIPAGQKVEEVVSLLDFAPTIVELAMDENFPCAGRSLVPLLQGSDDNWSSEAFAECHGQRFNYTQRIFWRDNHKYIFNGFADDELYDLTADPHELQNLAGEPDQRELLESMAARMWEIMEHTADKTMVEAQYGMFRFAPVGPAINRGKGI